MSTPSSAAIRYDASLPAGRVVRVEVDRHADLLLAAPSPASAPRRACKPGHVLDGEDVRAELLQFLRQVDVVLQVYLSRFGSRMSPV